MDSLRNIGDHNIFSKIMMGWVEPLFVTKDTDLTLLPVSGSEKPVAVILTNDADAGIFSEYFVLELYNSEGNNAPSLKCEDGAVKIYHVSADSAEVSVTFDEDDAQTPRQAPKRC